MSGFDVTEKKIRARQHEPSAYDRNTFRTVRLTTGVKAVVGVMKGEKNTSIQSILFDKKKFNEEQATAWLGKHHEKFSDVLTLEQQKSSLFVSAPVDFINEVLATMTDAQLERLANGLVLMAGPADDDNEDIEPEKMSSQFGNVI